MTLPARPWLPLVLLALFALGLALGIAPSGSDGAKTAAQLNVLLVIADGLGPGDPELRTPHLDRLASRGRRFTRAYSQYPLSGPSRASLLTGWRPDRTHVWRDKASLREHGPALLPLQQHFHEQGYFTARVGEVYGGQPEAEMKWDLVAEPPDDGGGASWAAGRAVQVLGERAAARFFVAVGLARPAHWKVPEQYASLYPPDQLRLAPELSQPPPALPAIAISERPDREARPGAWERPPAQTLDRLRGDRGAQRAYASWLDGQLGALLEALDRQQLWDSTVVVVLSDRGPYLWEHGAIPRSDLLFEETLRTLLIVAAPGVVQPGVPSDQIVELVDVYPTLVELAGLPALADRDGTSLAPLLASPERALKTAAFSVVRRAAGQLGRSVRTERYRYTEWPDGSEELYDHVVDPGELTNLASRAEQAAALEELRGRLGEAERAPAPASSAQRGSAGARRPNVLLIVSDDMTARLGCYGYDVLTPNVDRLSRKGRRFERAYCQVAMCSPSRTSFLSGRRPERLGIWDNLEPPKPRLGGAVPLPQHFKAHGYFTARVGKLFHQSFDADFEWDVAEHAPQVSEQEHEEEEAPRPRRRRQRGETDPAGWSVPTDRPDEQEPDGLRARRVAQLIEQHKDQPFFIALGFAKPHLRWVAPRRYFELYPPERVRVPQAPADDWADIPQIAVSHEALAFPGRFLRHPLDPDPPRREAIAGYSAVVSFVDAQLGVVLDTLDRLELWDETVVVLTSDHGYHLGDHGGLFRKDSLFEETLRVPLLIWAPGLGQPGAATGGLAELIDLYPTLTELARLPRPAGLDGTSLVPLLEDPARSVKSAAFSAARRRPPQLGWSLRTERYRYTEWPDGSRELYDHQSDPGERRNLAASAEHAATLARLREQLEAGWPAALLRP